MNSSSTAIDPQAYAEEYVYYSSSTVFEKNLRKNKNPRIFAKNVHRIKTPEGMTGFAVLLSKNGKTYIIRICD